MIDKTAPATTDDAPTDWVGADTTITFTPSDSGSGVASTFYTLDGGDSQIGTSVILTTEGSHILTYWSVDKAGNIETPSHSITVMIDKTAPATTDDAPTDWVGADTTITFTPSDSGSGVASTFYTLDGGDSQIGTSVTLTTEGSHTLTYWSVDKAGNIETPHHSITVMIDKTAPATTDDAPTDWVGADTTITFTPSDDEWAWLPPSTPLTAAIHKWVHLLSYPLKVFIR